MPIPDPLTPPPPVIPPLPLVSTATPPAPAVVPATPPQPAGYTIDPATDTVAGRTAEIIKADSPLMQQARTGALQQMNQRGLVNSTMAVTAGQDAMLRAATPIAAADAAANIRSKEFNAGAANQFGLQNLLGIQAADMERLRQEGSITLQKLAGVQEMDLQVLRGTQAENLANIEAQYKTLMQASSDATRIFTTYTDSIMGVLTDPNIPLEQKQQIINQRVGMLQTELAVIGAMANVDLAGLLDFGEAA